MSFHQTFSLFVSFFTIEQVFMDQTEYSVHVISIDLFHEKHLFDFTEMGGLHPVEVDT